MNKSRYLTDHNCVEFTSLNMVSEVGSRQSLILPRFATTTMLLIQSVGSVSLETIPFFLSSASFSLTSWCSVTVTRLGACCTGLTSGSTASFACPMCPSPSKTSLYTCVVFRS